VTRDPVRRAQQTSRRDFRSVLRRRWYVVVAGFLLVFGAALGMSFLVTPQFEATAHVVYLHDPRLDPVMFSLGGEMTPEVLRRRLQGVATTIVSLRPVAERAAAKAGVGSVGVLRSKMWAVVEGYTGSIAVVARSPDPKLAAAAADAFAEAWVEYRQELLVFAMGKMIEQLDAVLASYGPTQHDDPTYVARKGDRDVLKDLATKTHGDFRLTSKATVPTAPVVPNHMRDAALGLVGGLIVGVGGAFLADPLLTKTAGASAARKRREDGSEDEAGGTTGDVAAGTAEDVPDLGVN